MRTKSVTAVVICLCLASAAAAQECQLGKAMAIANQLVKQVKVETTNIDNGLVSVTVVPDNVKDDLAAAVNGVTAVVKQLKAREKVELCDSCKSMFEKPRLVGAKVQTYKTASTRVRVITSDDAAVVKQIHQFAASGKSRDGQYDALLAVSRSSTCYSGCNWNGYCLICPTTSYGCGYW